MRITFTKGCQRGSLSDFSCLVSFFFSRVVFSCSLLSSLFCSSSSSCRCCSSSESESQTGITFRVPFNSLSLPSQSQFNFNMNQMFKERKHRQLERKEEKRRMTSKECNSKGCQETMLLLPNSKTHSPRQTRKERRSKTKKGRKRERERAVICWQSSGEQVAAQFRVWTQREKRK